VICVLLQKRCDVILIRCVNCIACRDPVVLSRPNALVAQGLMQW
jgi:hypothetical protein